MLITLVHRRGPGGQLPHPGAGCSQRFLFKPVLDAIDAKAARRRSPCSLPQAEAKKSRKPYAEGEPRRLPAQERGLRSCSVRALADQRRRTRPRPNSQRLIDEAKKDHRCLACQAAGRIAERTAAPRSRDASAGPERILRHHAANWRTCPCLALRNAWATYSSGPIRPVDRRSQGAASDCLQVLGPSSERA